MNEISTPQIIAISGNMGAGKTTLALELANSLQGSYLCWDDFDEISKGPEDYIDWYKRGENYAEWDYPKLAETLEGLKLGKSIVHPVHQLIIQPKNYIIFDAPCGRFHYQTGIYIDTWLHVDVPLDVSLARWLLRDFKNTAKNKDELLEELEFYLIESRPLFDDTQYKSKADFIINGMVTTKQQIERVKQFLNI